MLHSIVLNDQMVTGGIIITVAAGLAMVFLLLTLCHILLALIVPTYAHRMSSSQERNFIMSPLGFYIICLFASNFITALGGVMEAQWVAARAITEGPACTTQAFTLQLGNNAAALWIAVISISALRTFMFRARPWSKIVTLPLIAVLWIVMIVFDGLASTIFADHSGNFFYGVANMWCWITPTHRTARLAIQYVWMWVWSLLSAVCFFFVFLSVRGHITVKRDRQGRSVRWNRRAFDSFALGSGEQQYGALVGNVGKTMCWFPISYITLTLPISVSRVGETFGLSIPTYAFVFSAVSVLLLGIVSPILYFAIRHSLRHTSTRITSEATLRGSFGEKLGAESFHTPQDKRPSPINNFDPYPWTPTPTTKEWVPPSPHHGVNEATSPSSASSYGAINSRGERMSAYRGSNALPKQVPVSLKLAQKSLHGHMGSISSVTSSGTVVAPVMQLSPVSEGDSSSESMNPHLTLPPAALVAHRDSLASPNLTVPTDSDKFANVPLSPTLRPGHKRSDTETSAYSGPRAISPDLKALLEASQTSAPPTGPPPPPRKTRRLPIPSVPVDVDESDQGSIFSARPTSESFDSGDTRPMSIGDVTSRGSSRRPDSMGTFWAAYDGGSPMTPNLPPNMPSPSDAASPKHDTMRTFWAAYEDPSPTAVNMPLPPDAASLRQKAMLDSNITALSPDSLQFRRLDPSVSLKPSLSAVGGTVALPKKLPSVPSTIVSDHQRSRSFTQMPTPPVPALHPSSTNLRTSNSATARLNSPQTKNAYTPAPSELNQSSEGSYRTPRPHPGYL